MTVKCIHSVMMIREMHAVYRIDTDFHDGPFFIGCCPLANVNAMQDAWTYSMFAATVKPTTGLRLTILGLYVDPIEAQQAQLTIATLDKVWINLKDERVEPSGKRGARGRPVRNVGSGVQYDSAFAAAEAIGCSPSAMSHHLSGRIHNIQGQRFERVMT